MILAHGAALALGLLIMILERGIKKDQRSKRSFRWLLLLVLTLGVPSYAMGMPGTNTPMTMLVLRSICGAATLGVMMVIVVRIVTISQRPKLFFTLVAAVRFRFEHHALWWRTANQTLIKAQYGTDFSGAGKRGLVTRAARRAEHPHGRIVR